MATLLPVNLIERLQEAEIIPKGFMIRRVVIDMNIDAPVMVYYETFADKLTVDICLDELLKNKDKLVAKRVTERMLKDRG